MSNQLLIAITLIACLFFIAHGYFFDGARMLRQFVGTLG